MSTVPFRLQLYKYTVHRTPYTVHRTVYNIKTTRTVFEKIIDVDSNFNIPFPWT